MSKTTGRIILTASLIPGEPGATTSTEIRQRLVDDGFEVSERTVQRNLRSLHEALPEDLVRDSGNRRKDRWFWHREARVGNLTGRTLSEALALTTLAGNFRHVVPGSILANLDAPIERAKKFLASTSQPQVRHWSDKLVFIHGPMYRQPPDTNKEIADTVTEAVYAERKVEIAYRTGHGPDITEKKEEVNPLGLLNRNNLMHLITDSGDPIPLHRIYSAKLLTITVPKPVREPLQNRYWRSPLGTSKERQLKLLLEVDSSLSRELEEQPFGKDQIFRKTADGACLVEATVRNDQALIDWLLINARKCRVIEPEALNQSICDLLHESLRHQEQAAELLKNEEHERYKSEYSVSHFWIDPYNHIIPIDRPHWSDILRNPARFQFDEATAGRPLHKVEKDTLLEWAVDHHWIAIAKSGNQWRVRSKQLDKLILNLVAKWASEMLDLDLVEHNSIVYFAGKQGKEFTITNLLEYKTAV